MGWAGSELRKVLYIVSMYSKYTRALTFENIFFEKKGSWRYCSEPEALGREQVLALIVIHFCIFSIFPPPSEALGGEQVLALMIFF